MSSTFKSVRLSASIRANIVQSMMAAWDKRQPCPHDTKSLEKDLGDWYWFCAFGSIKSSLKKIPPAMLRKSNTVKVQIEGKVCEFEMSETRAHPHEGQYNKLVAAIYDEADHQTVAYYKATEAVNDWYKSRNEFREEIKTILDSVQTTNQLIQLCPEAEQYLPPFAADPSKGINLPTLKTSRLNTLLGIK